MNAASLFVDTAPETQEAPVVRPKTLARVVALQPELSLEVRRLLEDAAARLGVTVEQVRSHYTVPGSRSKTVTAARHAFWWAVRVRWGTSFPDIGRMLGRDHTTAMSAVKRITLEVAKGTELGRIAQQLAHETYTAAPLLGLQGIHEQLGDISRGNQETAMGASAGPTASSASNEGSAQP